ncbi:MAG: hypothetical protein KGL39_43425 [Patescibacteria group bacterium]|nr:hypothetical protein [Patescibacteria group bacterium]
MPEDTLTRERLEELATPPTSIEMDSIITFGEIRALLDMAMRTEQAERERDALRDGYRTFGYEDSYCLFCGGGWGDESSPDHEPGCICIAALADPDAGGDAS